MEISRKIYSNRRFNQVPISNSADFSDEIQFQNKQKKYEIRDMKGTSHAKMGTVKDRNGMDIIEAEDIKK